MKLLSRILLCFLLPAMALPVQGEIPAGYYSSLEGKSDAELKTATYMLIHNFTQISSYSALPTYFRYTDVYPNSTRWWDMYSDIPLYAPNFSGLNREHSFPKSWWGGSTSVSAYVDLNHLYPSEMRANTAKSNYPLGEVSTATTPKFDNGVCRVGVPVKGQGGGAAYVFEPDEEYKGDFARTYFYMVTCYQNLTWAYTFMVNQNTYPTLNQWSIDLLLRWHRDDPVSQKEIDRNEVVYGYQNNRNPFIDYPALAEYIWGDRKGQPFSTGASVTPPQGEPRLLTPTVGMSLDFGEVALGHSTTTQLFVSGKDLRTNLTARLYLNDAEMFVLPVTSLPADQVSSDNGYWLNITYKPTAVGEHQSRVLLSGDFPGSRGVALRGVCLPEPVLSACTAIAATDIETDRYVANWTAPEGEEIDYFVVTRQRYTGNDVITEELVAEDTSLEITGFDQSDSEAYSVQSVRLEVRSPMSNVVFVGHSGINGVEEHEPLVVRSFSGMMRIECSRPQSGLRVFDTTGRLVMALESVSDETDIEMPSGIFLVVTDQHPTPVKVVIR